LRGLPTPIEAISFAGKSDADRRFSNEQGTRQDIKFTTSADGVRLARASVGEGRPVIKAPNWIQHLELDWENHAIAGLLDCVASCGRLVRFDSRGNGLSDWDAPEISLERFVDDLAAIYEAAGIDRAPIFGLSQGCAIAATFAARHPERVSGLLFFGGYAQGRAHRGPATADIETALRNMAKAG
jgi:pimeloyl-ACP methyl ester carboxylesterase